MPLTRRTLLGTSLSTLAAAALMPTNSWAQTATPVDTPDPTVWPVGQGANAARNRNMPGPGPSGDPILLWKSIGPITDYGTFADETLYAASGGAILAIDTRTGQERWRTPGFAGIPAIDGDGIILRSAEASGDGYDLVRLRRSDGTLAWSAETGKIGDNWTPVVADGVGYTPSGTDLIAFDPATGDARWRTPLAAPASRGAAVAEGMVVLGDQAGTFYGIAIADGHVVWKLTTDALAIGTPSIANGVAYFAGNGGATNAFYSVDLATGALRWRFPSPSGPEFRNAAIDATTVYFGNLDGVIYALDVASGALIWTFAIAPSFDSHPALIGDTLYVSSPAGFLHALDAADGSERWRFELDASSDFPPIIVAGVAYVATQGGTIYAIGGSESATETGITPVPTPATPVATAPDAPVVFVWATKGDANNRLFHPGTAAIDPAGNVWVTSMIGSILIFDSDGNVVETWGTPGSGEGQFAFSDRNGTEFGAVLFAPDGGFYVADSFNFRIQQFTEDRVFVRSWGSNGTGDGQFLGPGGMALDARGNLLVADVFRHDVQRFDPDGTFLDKFGSEGSEPGQFEYPALMAVAPDGNLWIAEIGNNRVQILKQDGTYVAAFGQGGDGHGGFNGPDQVSFDADGHAFVSDQFNNFIQVFDGQGRFLHQFGGFGTGDGRFSSAGSVAVGPDGAVYVVDWHGNRLEKFQIVGPFPDPITATPFAG